MASCISTLTNGDNEFVHQGQQRKYAFGNWVIEKDRVTDDRKPRYKHCFVAPRFKVSLDSSKSKLAQATQEND
ncbi:MAG: hypothetical protein ACOVQM_12170, partial [Pirellula sp.]